jgi:hypothetical protein
MPFPRSRAPALPLRIRSCLLCVPAYGQQSIPLRQRVSERPRLLAFSPPSVGSSRRDSPGRCLGRLSAKGDVISFGVFLRVVDSPRFSSGVSFPTGITTAIGIGSTVGGRVLQVYQWDTTCIIQPLSHLFAALLEYGSIRAIPFPVMPTLSTSPREVF